MSIAPQSRRKPKSSGVFFRVLAAGAVQCDGALVQEFSIQVRDNQ